MIASSFFILFKINIFGKVLPNSLILTDSDNLIDERLENSSISASVDEVPLRVR